MGRLRCWRCGEQQAPALWCAHCGAVQGPPSSADHFTTLGLPHHPAVDPDELSERYYALSRKLHPDRYQTGSPRELAESVRATAAVNSAFQTLRDVESRGRYWLGRVGETLGRDNNRVPPELAAQVFEVQEQIAELRAARADQRDRLRAAVARAEADIEERRAGKRRDLDQLLRDWPRSPATPCDESPAARNGTPPDDPRQRLKSLLSELSYLGTLDRDLRAALADQQATGDE